MQSLRQRMEAERELQATLGLLATGDHYPTEEELFTQLMADLPGGDYFTEEELAKLRRNGITKHWQFLALSMQRIRQLLPNGRHADLLRPYVATFALLPDSDFVEEDLRRFRDEPENYFATSQGIVLHWSLREASQRSPQERHEAPLRDAVFDRLEAHKIRFVADYVFHDQQKLFDMLGVWGVAGTVSYQQDLFFALNSLMRRIGISTLARSPTAAEQAVLDSLPRP